MLKIWACWEKTCQTSKAVKRRKCGLMLGRVYRKGGFAHLASCPVSWIFRASVFTAPLSYEAKRTRQFFWPLLYILTSHHISFHSLPFSLAHLFITSDACALCSLASSSQIQRLDYKITPLFPWNPGLLPLSSLWEASLRTPRLISPLWICMLLALPAGILSVTTRAVHMLLPQAPQPVLPTLDPQ